MISLFYNEKNPGDNIILQTCTKNDNRIMYGF